MYIFQNALKNIVRNKGRNILLAAIIFAIIATTVVTLMITNTSNRIIDEYKSQFGVEVTITRNLERFIEMRHRGEVGLGENVTAAQYIAFADSSLLQYSVFESTALVENDALIPVGYSGNAILGGGYVTPATMMLKGNNWDDFTNGFRAVIDGRMPERVNECIISTEFAELNNIFAGDAIQLFGMVLTQDEGRVDPNEYNLTVTGIYYSSEEVTGGSISWGGTLTNRLNEILTISETIDNNSEGVSLLARYYLKHPSFLDDFEQECRAKGLQSMYDVAIDEDTYNAIVGPIEGMRGITVSFMAIVLTLGAVILILLSSIAIRERKYEIGVLRAMGMKKANVALGLWSEMVFITLFCLVLGIIAGSFIAQPVSNTLLTQQVENAQKLKELSSGGYFTMNIGDNSRAVDDDPIAEINVLLGIDTILQLVLISLLLASAAGFATIGRITKYEPIKILMERN